MSIGEAIRGVEDTGSSVREVLDSIIADRRLNGEDNESMAMLTEIFQQDVDANYADTRAEISDMLSQSLRAGFTVRNEQDMQVLQKLLTFAGLGFNMQEIIDVNRNFLSTSIDEISGSIRDGVPSIPGSMIGPEDKVFTFKIRTNGDLEIYDHSNPDQWGNFRGNDIIGIVVPGSNVIQEVGGRGDMLENNNTVSTNTEEFEQSLTDDMQDEKISILANELEGKDLEISELNLSLTGLRERLEVALAAIETSTANNEQCRIDIENLKLQIDALNNTINILAQSLLTQREQIDINSQSISSINVEIQQCKVEIESLEMRLTYLEGEIIKIPQVETPSDIDISDVADSLLVDPIQVEPLPPVDVDRDTSDVVDFVPVDPISVQPLPPVGEVTVPAGELETSPRPRARPVQDEVAVDVADIPFHLNNPVNFWEIGKESLAQVPMQSKADLINLLEKYQGQGFPQTHYESSEYAYAFQCAISFLVENNTLGTIDGYWGPNSAGALRNLQQNVLGLSGNEADGKPGPNTLSTIIRALN